MNEIVGECVVKYEASSSTAPKYYEPLKTKRHNIGTEKEPKMAIIGDYRDQETVTQVVDLLKGY